MFLIAEPCWMEWSVKGGHNQSIIGPDGEVIAFCRFGAGVDDKANARLMAAIPELVAKVDTLLSDVEPVECHDHLVMVNAKDLQALSDALNLARGQQ
jgi:hypothetical protein